MNPTQQRVLDELMGRRAERPSFPDNIAESIRAELEARLAPSAAGLEGGDLFVSKAHLAQVLQCEAYHLAEFEEGFEWTVANARGTVSHKAVELAIGLRREVDPTELVEMALARLVEDGHDWSPSEWLRNAPEVEVAEVRMAAIDWVTKFQDGFPPLKTEWRPRVESRLDASFCDDTVVLHGKVDLALGRADGNQARVLIVDFKTGRPAISHLEDLRYYAVLETLRTGVPPFRVASYYLDSGSWHAEDVTDEILRSTTRRIADGVARIVEVRVRGAQANLTPGPQCGWCVRRQACEGAVTWAAAAEDRGPALV